MPETCIVCLGDLSTGNGGASAIPSADAKSPAQDGAAASSKKAEADQTTRTVTNPGLLNASQLIARINSCGHIFHQECLAPWIERANSCPMCRATFNVVEVKETDEGPIVSTVVVEDRTQVADIDPTIFLEPVEDYGDEQPCQGCGEDDNEDVLLICDGCDKMWHTYCMGLTEVPVGAWFCDNCRAQRATDPRPRATARTVRSVGRRTAGQRRRHRGFRNPQEESWNEVWNNVWSSINLDLDFPYNDDDASATYMRRDRQRSIHSNRMAHGAFERRMEIARFAGAGNSFRQAESAFANDGAHRAIRTLRNNLPSPRPQVVDLEEASAWAAFDQARAASAEPSSSRRRKRKSGTASPAEPEARSTPITVKRRRTSQSAAPTSGENRQYARPQPASPTPRRSALNDNAGPSFLQSLLQEVEESSHASSRLTGYRPSLRTAGSPPADQTSPRPSSPALSPSPSNHSSPRAMSATPPPVSTSRPNSPTSLSSSIQPIYPTIEYSPIRVGSPPPKQNGFVDHGRGRPRAPLTNGTILAQPQPRSRVPPFLPPTSPPPTVGSSEASPRPALSLTAKEDVQQMVKAALKPHYNDQTISKDEYTAINRDISRMLYDRIGDFESLDTIDKAKWEQVAGDEVRKKVGALKAQG